MRRDTILVRPNGNIVLRFKSDNPGIWLFHCHIEWHVASGLIATMVEDPISLQKQLDGKIPEDHLQVRAQLCSNRFEEGLVYISNPLIP